jgi:hypothetical protein
MIFSGFDQTNREYHKFAEIPDTDEITGTPIIYEEVFGPVGICSFYRSQSLRQASLPGRSGLRGVAEALRRQPAPRTHAECGKRIGIAGFGA